MKLHDLTYFNRSDRRALYCLALVLTVGSALFLALGGEDDTTSAFATDSTATTRRDSKTPTADTRAYDSQSRQPARRFTFDPNTADSTQLLALGLSPWQVRSVYRYRAAGGVFGKPEDFARL